MSNPLPLIGRRILILAPHADDEVVACAATAARAARQGAELFILFLTNGCVAREDFWPWQRKDYAARVAARRREAEEAATRLGLTIVGYQTERPSRHLWREMAAVRAEIDAAIAAHDIDQLWAPAYEGGHSDHDALNALCATFKDRVSVLEFAEYNFARARANAQTFPREAGQEVTHALTEGERAEKRALLALYASEAGNLGYVGTAQECYRPLAAYDYAAPPHEGRLWYTRFHWVPFRHPRIDFTTPQEVSAAIEALAPSPCRSPLSE